MNSRFI